MPKKPNEKEIPAPVVEESISVAIEPTETVIPEAAPEVKPQEETPPVVDPPQEAPAPVAPQPEARVKVRVLHNGLRVAGGVAAKGKQLNVKLSEAKTLESLGKVTILGV